MIFKPELIDAILAGRKTQTRRLVKPGEYLICADSYGEGYGDGPAIEVTSLRDRPDKYEMTNYSKWVVGRTYAIVPKRGMPAVWWIVNAVSVPVSRCPTENEKSEYASRGWQPLRIRITAIRQERLQNITEADARAEGVADVAAYRALWDSINGKAKGARWQDNPDVFVLEFELVREAQA